MYSFAQRNDTVVFDEPFYAIYLTKSGSEHPGKQEVISAQSSNEDIVKKMIAESSAPVAFIKNMAHHMEVMQEPFIENATNIFLIRDPYQIIASYSQVIGKPVMRDIGIEYQLTLFELLKKKGDAAVVVDSGQVLADPDKVLKELCRECSIPFQESMLRWQSGPKPYDGIWAKYWYDNVHRSTGFERQKTSSRALRDDLKPLHEQARYYYEKLLPFSLKA
jgi:hypothetical protein